MRDWSRREFIRTSAWGLAVTATGRLGWPAPRAARVSLVRLGGGGRGAAIRQAVELAGVPDLAGRWVALKPNFNSSDPFPGSTHPDTLGSLARYLKELGAERVSVADRSGMGDTQRVMREKGVLDQAEALGFDTLALESLPRDRWAHVEHPELHWGKGFYLGGIFRDAEAIVQTCCLKTHRFGGHFTMSLKNSVGMVARSVPALPHDFMRELHSSRHQRRMIAELNLAYDPAIVVMDAVECFTDGGPDKGTVARPNAVLASTDRVALDAVGVAMLRHEGTTPDVAGGAIFELDQIARAAELGIGVDRPDRIEIVTADAASSGYAERLREILLTT